MSTMFIGEAPTIAPPAKMTTVPAIETTGIAERAVLSPTVVHKLVVTS